jgi:uncharacterized protein (TIGR02118 family)
MERSMLRLIAPVVLLAAIACAKPANERADSTGVAAAAAASTSAPTPAAPGWAVVVLYNQPKDTAAFEKYYASTHLPLVSANQKEIGFTRAVLVKFPRNLDGSAPGHYRMAELWFDSEDALRKGTATAGFKKVAGDLKNFATGGLIALTGQETR